MNQGERGSRALLASIMLAHAIAPRAFLSCRAPPPPAHCAGAARARVRAADTVRAAVREGSQLRCRPPPICTRQVGRPGSSLPIRQPSVFFGWLPPMSSRDALAGSKAQGTRPSGVWRRSPGARFRHARIQHGPTSLSGAAPVLRHTPRPEQRIRAGF